MTKLILKLLAIVKKLAKVQSDRLKDKKVAATASIVKAEEERSTAIELADKHKQQLIDAAIEVCKESKKRTNAKALERKEKANDAISSHKTGS